jgi:hypothetical protein
VRNCHVCGRRFDPLDFQVVIPELGRGFDRIECAQTARALASPGSRIAAAPLAAVVEPIGLAAPGPTAALQTFAAPAGTIGLLAAGTAAAVFLWLRVLGTDPVGFPFIRADAPRAAAAATVESRVSRRTPETTAPVTEAATPQAENPRRIVISAPSSGGSTVAGQAAGGEPTVLARQPSASDRGVDQQGSGKGKGNSKAKGKGKDKGHHGNAQGHVKHGGSGGGGQGGGHAGGPGGSSGHGQGNGGGYGKSHGHGKKH